ncbi:MAG: hypothetical protein QM761_13460 [Pseudoxanthomonas sp.]
MSTIAATLYALALTAVLAACARSGSDDAASPSPPSAPAFAATPVAQKDDHKKDDEQRCRDEDEDDEFRDEMMREEDDQDLPPCSRPAKSWRIKGGQNDLVVDTVVCRIHQPFDIKSTSGIVLHLSGGVDGGVWTQSGTAAGMHWSGGGSYALSLDEQRGGRLQAIGNSTITSPIGVFSDKVQPSFTVTPSNQACN